LKSKELSLDCIPGRFNINSYNNYHIHEDIMNEKVVALGRDRIKIAKGAEKPVEVYLDETVDTLLFTLEKTKHINDKVVMQLLLFLV